MKKFPSMKTNLLVLTFLIFSNFSNAQCWNQIVAGNNHTAGIQNDGTLWAWGSNDKGQLGNGTNVSSSIPIKIGTENNWAQLGLSDEHTLALKDDGTLWGWGLNIQGELGQGDFVNVSSPVQIGSDTDWTDVWTSADRATYAKKSNGTLWACGNNYQSQLGLGIAINPILVLTQIGTDTDWDKLAPMSTCLAIKNNGTLWGWGNNAFNQLGSGVPSISTTPVQIGSDTDWAEISIAGPSCLAIKQDGTLWSWGYNNYGQLGHGNTNGLNVPTQVGTSTDWSKLYSGSYANTFAQKTDGTFWSWGNNQFGVLGLGDMNDRHVPTLVPGLNNCTMSKHSAQHVVALNLDGKYLTWGYNIAGQLGNNSLSDVFSPTIVNSCSSLSIETKVLNQHLVLYPNPTSGQLFIENSDRKIDKIELYDLSGKLIFSELLNTYEHQINLDELSNATFILKVHSDDKIENRIVVKI